MGDFLKGGDLSNDHALSTVATIPQIRMTRRPVGKYEMDTSDDHKYFADSIGLISNWKKKGPIYEVPFGALIGDLKNVIAAGRCISNTDAMWDVTRVIPCCAVTGEAAGIAAALAIDEGVEVADVNMAALQAELSAQDVMVHFDDAWVPADAKIGGDTVDVGEV
jgi:hypothetical protein